MAGDAPSFVERYAEFVEPEFPLEILPPTLAAFVDAEHRAMGADPGAIAMAPLNAVSDDYCRLVTGGLVVWGVDLIAPKTRDAVSALRARERFAVNGPSDAPPLPLSQDEVEDYRIARV